MFVKRYFEFTINGLEKSENSSNVKNRRMVKMI